MGRCTVGSSVGLRGTRKAHVGEFVSEATPQNPSDNFTTVILLALTGIVAIPQGEQDVTEAYDSDD